VIIETPQSKRKINFDEKS